MRSSEQTRAQDAFARVGELDAEDIELRQLYRAYADRLGPAVIMNGLGQALATELAAGGTGGSSRERAHRKLYENIQGWVCRDNEGIYAGASDLLQAVITNDQSIYLMAQAEVLAWLDWHKKACRASLPPGAEE